MSSHPSLCLDVWKYGCQDVSPSFGLSVCAYIRMSGHLSFFMTVSLSVWMSRCLSSVCLDIGLPIYVFVSMFGYLDVCLSIWIYVWMSQCMFVNILCVSIWRSISLDFFLSIYYFVLSNF